MPTVPTVVGYNPSKQEGKTYDLIFNLGVILIDYDSVKRHDQKLGPATLTILQLRTYYGPFF